jgi:TetR/AcrR family transcriptional repressor of uid operon
MPKVLPVYLENRRHQIIDASAACFARGGFHRTTMQDICHEAGLSPGALYRYFQSKEEIILAMCDRGRDEDVDTIHAAMDLGDTKSAFGELIRIYFSGVDDHEYCALMVELLSEAPRNEQIGESLREGWTRVKEPMATLVAKAQERGEINPELDASAVAAVMLGVYQGLVVQYLIAPELDVEAYARVTKALFDGMFWSGDATERAPKASSALRH